MVELGVTVAVPVAANDPRPEMLTAVALVLVQLRTVEPPALMVAGCAVNVTVTFRTGVTGDVTGEGPPPQAISAAIARPRKPIRTTVSKRKWTSSWDLGD